MGAVWSPLMWMKLNEMEDWVWVKIQGRCNMILITFQRYLYAYILRDPWITDVRSGPPKYG